MTNPKTALAAVLGLSAFLSGVGAAAAEEAPAPETLRGAVDAVVKPLMAANDIPGMAVAVTAGGRTSIFNYGVTSVKNGAPVDDRTIFEIGSISKTFTGTLGAYVEARGKLTLSDPASRYLAQLEGTAFDRVSLLDLATYTAGGLPLQFPEDVGDDKRAIDYFAHWTPRFAPGTKRLYSNPSIGLFGDLAARAEGVPFDRLMTETVLPGLGLKDTFLTVPEGRMRRYAFGTSKTGQPIRVGPGALAFQAYGIKTTASDLARFVELSMDPSSLDPALRAAVATAQTGYVRFGDTMQGLGWEIYDAPVSRETVSAASEASVALAPQDARRLDPPVRPQDARFVNKTGSTNGFGAYAAFWPDKRLGIVLLANRSYPNTARVDAAFAIRSALD